MLKFPPDERCPQCGGMYALIGHRHLCRGDRAPAPVTESVTHHPPTKPVTDVTPAVTCERCIFLEAEVRRLKRDLAQGGMKVVGLSAAERMRRMRARRRASAGQAPQ
jgi:hypothetical protein